MKKLILATIVAAAVIAGPVVADDVTELKQEIQKQYDMLLKMQMQISELENKQSSMESQSSGSIINLAKAEALTIGGDFRYRHERIDNDGDIRNRERIRARLNMNYKINENTEFDLRVATGSDDPVSTNQTLDDSFTSKGIYIDRAYLTWKATDTTKVLAGKMGVPFYQAGKNQLIWDGDLSPEGIAVQHGICIDDCTAGFVNAGAFYVEEEGSDASEVSLWGVQGGIKKTLANDSKLTAGVSYYDYHNIKGKTPLYDGKFFRNSNDGTVYTSDYNIFEAFGNYDTKMCDMPVSVYGSWVKNVDASTSEDTGWLVGTKINKAKKPGTWEISYDYRDLEADAVVGTFSDSDFAGGGTDAKGHRIGGAYAIAKNVTIGVNHFMDKVGAAEDDYNRTQFDVQIKF